MMTRVEPRRMDVAASAGAHNFRMMIQYLLWDNAVHNFKYTSSSMLRESQRRKDKQNKNMIKWTISLFPSSTNQLSRKRRWIAPKRLPAIQQRESDSEENPPSDLAPEDPERICGFNLTNWIKWNVQLLSMLVALEEKSKEAKSKETKYLCLMKRCCSEFTDHAWKGNGIPLLTKKSWSTGSVSATPEEVLSGTLST